MTRQAIIPRNRKDPTGTTRLQRGAIREGKKRMREIRSAYIEALNSIPTMVVNKRYTFQLDAETLQSLLDNLGGLVDQVLAGSQKEDSWLFRLYGEQAFRRGAAQAQKNISVQVPEYPDDLQSLLLSEPYRRRLAITASRQFEEMKGLSGDTKKELARVLTDGIGRGKNPRDIAKEITRRTNVGASRAARIARTEIPMALRRSRWDESHEAQERYGFRLMLMHLSALSPTTRPDHAARNGKLYTEEEVADWYAEDANAIN